MNWIAENFTSTAKAWNTLCDAVEERAEVYQIDLESSGITIPRHKEAPVKWDFDFIRMREAIFRIFQVSYLPLWFNTWQTADTDYRGAWDDFVLNSDVFNKLGIDSHAFFRVSPGAVTPRHTVSQFIFNAAKFINDEGKICIMIAAEGPGEAQAVITAPAGLKSLCGRTVFADGKYKFSGQDITCDILIQD